MSLSGNAHPKQFTKAGKYKQAGESGGLPYWVKGHRAIWYDNTFNRWRIGNKEYLGTSRGDYLHSTSASACPTTAEGSKALTC